MTDTQEEQHPMLRVSEIGEFIRFQSCERRFKLGLNNRKLARELPFAERLFNTLDPVLQEAGRSAEETWETELREQGLIDLTNIAERNPEDRSTSWEEFSAALANLSPGVSAYGREISLSGSVGQFELTGSVDFILALWDQGTLRIRVVECKASRKDRTYHRIQLAAYVQLLHDALLQAPLNVVGRNFGPEILEAAVARIDEVTNEPQDILTSPPLNLDIEEADLIRLLSRDGVLTSIVETELDELDFQLETKCDSCVFSVHCLPESSRRRSLHLLSLSPASIRALHVGGVTTIDELADFDLTSDAAVTIRQSEGFDANLDQLVAKASARRSTLQQVGDEREYNVQAIPNSGQGQLPAHEQNGQRLVRIYLAVDYDYSENRIGALSAHITTSEFCIDTPFDPESRRPIGLIDEIRTIDGQGEPNRRALSTQSRDVVRFKTHPWTGINDQDTAAEREIIQQFFDDLIDNIGEVAEAEQAPIHFYVWSRSEMTQLVEGCSRASSTLLSHLRELLGCRESLEQLIFSCVQDEANTRFALGWTGRGLVVASSLTWFGKRYHWTRRVSGQTVELNRIFEQDIFDFKTRLGITAEGNWARNEAETESSLRLEIRSRFNDSLSAPYWRARWGTLPDPETVNDARIRASIERYNRVNQTVGLLRAYLTERVHALRWVEERVRFKNDEIVKPSLSIAELRQFDLAIDSTGRAAIDFLRLDHHVKLTDWLAQHIQPPAVRVQAGRTLPLREVASNADRQITAQFDLDYFGLTSEELSLRSSISEGSFVRISPHRGDFETGQTLGQLTTGGITCTVAQIDWEQGSLVLNPIFGRETDYVLSSYTPDPNSPLFDHATLDESVSDYVAGRVENRLRSGHGIHAFGWFDPEAPDIPAQSQTSGAIRTQLAETVNSWTIPGTEHRLRREQQDVILDGISTRVQLLQGPPGTGKTVTTGASVIIRCIANLNAGDVVLVSANTHTAVDTIIERIAAYVPTLLAEARRQGLTTPNISVAKVHSNDAPEDEITISHIKATSCIRKVNQLRRDAVLIIGGTTPAMLKMVAELSTKKPYVDEPGGFDASMLIVDEASMMVFPHFLALATVVREDAEIMLAGDNRQLAPIVAHDWENEDRPPSQLYQPFRSAYDAVRRIIIESEIPETQARLSQLTFTLRLPPLIRNLISRIYRDLDNIELEGNEALDVPDTADVDELEDWNLLWQSPHSLLLVTHNERNSRQSNAIECDIIEGMIDGNQALAPNSIAIITPHRAQRAMLRERLQRFAHAVTIIDTVERLQGGERPIIIVSATASDPNAISNAANFILNLNRANVAFSRAQERLIVVCASTLIDHIPSELEDYENSLLWKSVRQLCTDNVAAGDVRNHQFRILAPELHE
ncbi:MAG: AAA domain-containing protein [Pseudomonadota bacterium]